MALSKRKRFEVFKRDGFTCQYCGRKPPNVTLEADHVTPVCEGGDDDLGNLITACFDCSNRGKAGIPLDITPGAVIDQQRLRIEALEQALAAEKVRKKAKRLIEQQMQEIEHDFLPEGRLFIPEYRRSLRMFLERLGYEHVYRFMSLADGKIGVNTQNGWKYFCGCCWGKIRELEGRQ